MAKLPVLFLSHGAGPIPFMDFGGKGLWGSMDKHSVYTQWFKQLPSQLGLTGPRKPKAILMFSAHWESPTPDTVFVSSQANHLSLSYDYPFKLPPEMYKLKYPCRGDPELAAKVIKLINEAKIGVTAKEDQTHNLDNGAFVPLTLMFPEADIPVVQVSLLSQLDPLGHIALGHAVAPLRQEGVLIIGSGQATHHSFDDAAQGYLYGSAFVEKLSSLVLSPSGPDARSIDPSTPDSRDEVASPMLLISDSKKEETHQVIPTLSERTPRNTTLSKHGNIKLDRRIQGLINWQKLPYAREVHVREEHLLPLHVSVGAAGQDFGMQLSYLWGGCFALASYCWGSLHPSAL